MRNDNLRGMEAPLFDAETLERLYGEPDKARPFRANPLPCDDDTAFLVCILIWAIAVIGSGAIWYYILLPIAKGCMVRLGL